MTVKLTFLAQVKDYDDLRGLREQIGMCFEELGDVRLTGVFQVMDGTEPQKIERGAYGKVMLSDSGYEELIRRFGKEKTDALIDELSWKLYQKRYRYNDHFAVIVEWSKQQAVSDNNSVLRLNTANCKATPNCYGRADTSGNGKAASFDVDEFFDAAVKRTADEQCSPPRGSL